MIVAGDLNFPVSVLIESGWMRRLQLHVLQPDSFVPTFVTKKWGELLRLCGGFQMLRFKGHCRSSGRWLEVRQFNLSGSTRAKRSLQTLPPSVKGLQIAAQIVFWCEA